MLLENIAGHRIFLYAMMVVAMIGVIGKILAQITLKRMRKEAENIHNSNHKLMKLIKAKYEHANIKSDRVKNISIFVDKYLYGYRFCGISLYTWQTWELKCMWLILILGVLGAVSEYLQGGMSELVFQCAAWMGVFATLQLLLYVMGNERVKVAATRTYIIDYLENVCAHRYEKLEVETPVEVEENESIKTAELKEKAEKEIEMEKEQEKVALQKEAEEKRISQEMRIREILEEFLA